MYCLLFFFAFLVFYLFFTFSVGAAFCLYIRCLIVFFAFSLHLFLLFVNFFILCTACTTIRQ